MSHNRAKDWFLQAENDLLWAKLSLKNNFYSQVCFIAQQVGEKAIKSIAYHLDYTVKGHSIALIAKELKINGEVEEACKYLDLYYISARYPDALPAGAPFQNFTAKQATEAVQFAEVIIEKARLELGLSK